MRTLISLATLALVASSATAQQSEAGEENTYRYGGTYSTVGAGSAASCAALCNQDQTCMAWSFQRATEGLGEASCELKSTIGRSISNPLMTSGINPRIATVGQARQRRIPSTDTLLGAPVAISSANTVVRNSTASSQPAALRPPLPLPAPVSETTSTSDQGQNPTPPPAQLEEAAPPPPPVEQAVQTEPTPPSAVLTRSEIDALVEKSERPADAVLLDAPPPQVSFTPLEGTKVTIHVEEPETKLETVALPSDPMPQPQATGSRPYKNLRNRTHPRFSVNNGTALTLEELEQQQALADLTIERVEIDSEDLATDIGQPVVRDQIRQRSRVSAGGGS